ncbi:MAG: ribonuclease H-like domain-containing protein [Candidatus Bathyarchaeia archaeon]
MSSTKIKDLRMIKASELLRQKSEELREYTVAQKPTPRSRFSRGMSPRAWLYESEYEKALKLKERLLHDFEGKSLEKVIPGHVISNEYGECYRVLSSCVNQLRQPDLKKSRDVIISDLKLIYGIGPIREQKLNHQGYNTIDDLLQNSRWRLPAKDVLELIDSHDVRSLQRWLWRCLPKSHPLVHYSAGFCRKEDFAFLDIETLGLFGRPIILLGVARPKDNVIEINQYLLRDIPDEPGALWEVVLNLGENAVLVSFNGRSFDVPFIQERLGYYSLEASFNCPHYDLLHFARRAWRKHLPNCRLETIEQHLGIHRDIDLPSALVPDFYHTYLKTRNVGPLIPIVEHNKQDLITLTSLFTKLYEVWKI